MLGPMTTNLKLGSTGPSVFPIGLGCMGMSGSYGPSDEAEGIATIHAAIDAGVTLIDTGDFYGMGHNELLIGKALAQKPGARDRVQLSVKFGAMRGPDGSWLGFDARPAAVQTWLAYTLNRLGVEAVDVYRPARLDGAVPIEDTIGAIADLVKKGYVRHIGLSEVGADTIRRAAAVHPIVDLQIEYSIASRGPEAKVFPALDELGISATLYGVFSRGLLTGAKVGGPGDYRAHLPRFAGAAAEKNAVAVEALRGFADARGLTLGQLAIAWVRAKTPHYLPVVGARTRAQLADALGALDKPLTADDLGALERLVPAGAFAGARYQEAQMAHLDSER